MEKVLAAHSQEPQFKSPEPMEMAAGPGGPSLTHVSGSWAWWPVSNYDTSTQEGPKTSWVALGSVMRPCFSEYVGTNNSGRFLTPAPDPNLRPSHTCIHIQPLPGTYIHTPHMHTGTRMPKKIT